MNRIFIVEDDDSIRQLVLYALKNSGYEAQGFPCASEFFSETVRQRPDLVLLDIMLPDMDGVEILRQLRRPGGPCVSVPVMMLTAKGSEFDKVNALDLGADDYMTKPFGVMELLSRVRALLRRTGGSQTAKSQSEGLLTCGAVTLDRQRHTVAYNGHPVALTYKEFELLAFLLQNQGLVLTRDQLMQAVWGFDFEGESRTVDMHIKQLRQKLGEGGGLIQTVRGVGYKLTESAEVRV